MSPTGPRGDPNFSFFTAEAIFTPLRYGWVHQVSNTSYKPCRRDGSAFGTLCMDLAGKTLILTVFPDFPALSPPADPIQLVHVKVLAKRNSGKKTAS
jgi:hypothetical protein